MAAFLACLQSMRRVESGNKARGSGKIFLYANRPISHATPILASSVRQPGELKECINGLLSLPVSGVGSRPRSAEGLDPRAGR